MTARGSLVQTTHRDYHPHSQPHQSQQVTDLSPKSAPPFSPSTHLRPSAQTLPPPFSPPTHLWQEALQLLAQVPEVIHVRQRGE